MNKVQTLTYTLTFKELANLLLQNDKAIAHIKMLPCYAKDKSFESEDLITLKFEILDKNIITPEVVQEISAAELEENYRQKYTVK